ncbi:hypothetical protein SAMD00020551_2695 [Mesobacillus selenatarsenatis SF-1]|uniref:Uncharacterized protein n=1 Tax=Mesobacillus selenatarsenatis (strain DSM 18680 / JCM 14380 / FERM P-15431 / SF-1) TaxID=1321606 RepID=A0A0A8X5K5_MESS1|nr:hypothetical protein SAMD00020551_2695 [Mesobacillus selenatarsenatis SF-1]
MTGSGLPVEKLSRNGWNRDRFTATKRKAVKKNYASSFGLDIPEGS